MEGRGVFSTKQFDSGQVLCHYGGVLLETDEFEEDRKFLLEFPVNGTETWFFNHYKNTPSSFGKMLNHSSKHPNAIKKVFQDRQGQPIIIFIALGDIDCETELLHNYGNKYQPLPPCSKNCKICKGSIEIFSGCAFASVLCIF
jgi:hypothetical protein